MLEHKKRYILVAPLDWGLGHTTRCIPVIYELLRQGANILAAGTGVQISLLKQEFPDIDYIPLNGYNVHYSAKKNRFLWTMAKQMPAILSAIKAERIWLRKLMSTYTIEGIISDNRFGLSHETIPSVFITHQLRIKNPLGKRAEALTQRINYKWINQFSHCWIPDYQEHPGLAGALSHPVKMPSIPCSYIGPLSRMQPVAGSEKKQHILVILSGPEPQRSLFENMLFKQLPLTDQLFVVVRGLPNDNGPVLPAVSNALVYNHLPADKLNQLMSQAAVIICRSGYSSIMDMNAVGAKPILVPTPGQTEQEYLAELLHQSKRAIVCSQEAFDLLKLLTLASSTDYTISNRGSEQLLARSVARFLER